MMFMKSTPHFSQNTSYKKHSKHSEVQCWCPNLQIDLFAGIVTSVAVLLFLPGFPYQHVEESWSGLTGGSPWNPPGLGDWAKSFCVVAVQPGQKDGCFTTSLNITSGYKWNNWISMDELHSKIIRSKVKYEHFSGWSNHLCNSTCEPPTVKVSRCLWPNSMAFTGSFWSYMGEEATKKEPWWNNMRLNMAKTTSLSHFSIFALFSMRHFSVLSKLNN